MIRYWFSLMGGSALTAAVLLFAAGAAHAKGGGGGGHGGGGHGGGGHSSGGHSSSGHSSSHSGGYNMHHNHSVFFFGGGYYPYWWYNYNSAYYSYPTTAYADTSAGPDVYQAFYPPPDASGDVPVLVRVWLPADAEIWFNGAPVARTGAYREFMSPPLPPGKGYVYEVRARWTVDGQPVEQTRTVRVRAGDRVSVDFTRSAADTAK